MDCQTEDAFEQVDGFIARNPDYTRQGVEQIGEQRSTNRIVFARRGAVPVVFKVFCEEERKERECFGLRHWHGTGLVPDLLCDAGPRTIVISHVPGMYLHQAREAEGEAAWREACRAVGSAVAALTRVPLSLADRTGYESRFYAQQPTLEAYLGCILELARGIHRRDPDFRDAFWQANIDFIAARMDRILSEPRVLYHQDVSNLHVEAGRFVGFFDFEMCRVGCAAMQLGSAFGQLVREGDGSWDLFRDGWVETTGSPLGVEDLEAAAAVRHLLGWREISRYLSYDGTPGSGFAWAAPADPAEYRESMASAERMLGIGLCSR